MVLPVVLPVVLSMHSYGHDDLASSFHPNILQTKCWDNVNIMQVVSMDGSSSNGVAKLNSVCNINNFRLLPCLVGVLLLVKFVSSCCVWKLLSSSASVGVYTYILL